MTAFLGNTEISELWLGDTEIKRAYIGSTLVFGTVVSTITLEDPEDQDSSGDITLDYTIDIDDSSVEFVLFEATEDDPDAADFDGGGAPTYVDLGTASLVTSGGDIDITLPADLKGNYKFAALPTGGGDAHVAVSAAVAIDTTGSVLSSVAFTDTGGAANWAFTPDEDSAAATGYRVSLWPDGTDPSDALIESGTGATATVTGTASDSVAESGMFSGLTAATYQPTIFYQDAVGNKVFETYADVVVTAGSSWSITGGDEVLTVTSQPTAPATPTITGGENTLTVTG